MRPRGPDDENSWGNDCISLGHTRLSIIDLTSAGRQPMWNENKDIAIIFNGEIYNFLELKGELRTHHTYESRTDTEIILHAYEEFGFDCVERLNGMWAFAIYDMKKNILFISRDRFGIKPLYYHWDDGKLIFSSEIKGILELIVNPTPNDAVIFDFLTYSLTDHSRETFFEGINRVLPGENLILDLNSKVLKFVKWYDLNERVSKSARDDDINTTIAEIKALFFDSITHQLNADVPIGSCLSGGIDSSSIVCAIRKIDAKRDLRTFSLIFPGEKIDESQFINIVIRDTNVQRNLTTISEDEIIEDMDDLIYTQEEPFPTLSVYGQYKVMRMANRNKMKVLLDGQGADEIFCGYPRYVPIFLLESILSFDLWTVFSIIERNRKNILSLIKNTIEFALEDLSTSSLILKEILLKRKKYVRIPQNLILNRKTYRSKISTRNEMIDDISLNCLPALLRYEDRNSMRWSIESRVPFLDHRLVERAFFCPTKFKLLNGESKYAFRKSMDGIVAKRILERRDKIAFATPDNIWMKNGLISKYIEGIIGSQSFASRKYWNQKEVSIMLSKQKGGKRNFGGEIWRIVCTELWMRKFIDRSSN